MVTEVEGFEKDLHLKAMEVVRHLNRFEVIVVMEEVIEENVVEVEVVAIVVEVEVVVIVVGGGVVVKEVTEEVVGFCPVGVLILKHLITTTPLVLQAFKAEMTIIPCTQALIADHHHCFLACLQIYQSRFRLEETMTVLRLLCITHHTKAGLA